MELLHLVSRAQALLAELQRLSDRVPPELQDPSGSIYAPLLFGFKYFKSPEVYENNIEASPDLVALDDDFRENYMPLLERFFLLFDGIVKYYKDLIRYLEELLEGVYNTVESILHDEEACQLLTEAMTLHGVLLMMLEHRLNGTLREHLLVSYLRCRGSSNVPNFDSICCLCRSYPQPQVSQFASVTSFLQPSRLPVPSTMIMLNRPDEIFARFPLPGPVMTAILSRLRSDDLYHQINHYPNPEHRSCALAAQVGSLLVLLFYAPEVLQSDINVMREIVDKFFRGLWVIPIFMGFTLDLSVAWDRYKAAKSALASYVSPSAARALAEKYTSKVGALVSDLSGFLSEGVLTQNYVLNNVSVLLSCLRDCNLALRWLLLHRVTANRKLRDTILGAVKSAEETLLTLLLDTAVLEFEVKRLYGELLSGKQQRWNHCRSQAAECMQELSDFFSGSKILAKKIKDESLQQWFLQMASQVGSLDCSELSSTGRKIQQMVAALEEVEQFHQIEASLQTKQYLHEVRAQLQEMIRTLNVREKTLATIAVVSDASYAWGLISTFTNQIHARIQADPFTVLKLQCLFLKLRSVMDLPLLRISQCESADLLSVSEYYSSELVSYVRTVLEIVPVSMFSILNDVIVMQTKQLKDIPGRIEKDNLRDYAQLDVRYALAKATQRVAVFTQGIMAMKKRFIGAIELDPRQLLEDGIRKQLVKEIAAALHGTLLFTTGQSGELEGKLQELSLCLQSQRQSMEYFQDYVHVHGLRLWEEEYLRIINHTVEQERNYYQQKKCQSRESCLEKPEIPIPKFSIADKDPSKSPTFMGRLVFKLLQSTDPSKSMYLPPMSGWFSADGQELVGLRTLTMLQSSLGPLGMSGIDHLLCFEATSRIQKCLSVLESQIDEELDEKLQILQHSLIPVSSIPDAGISAYSECLSRIGITKVDTCIEDLAKVGQVQLLRCVITSQFRAASQVDSGLVTFALNGVNSAILSSVRDISKEHGAVEFSSEMRRLLGDISRQIKICGISSPLHAIYLNSPPPKHVVLVLFLLTVSQMHRYVLDTHLGTLTSRTKKAALDCCPLVVGFAAFLYQFHPVHTNSYVQYLAQYVQTQIEARPPPSGSMESSKEVKLEVVNTVAWFLAFIKYAGLPYHIVESSLPPLIFQRSNAV